MTKHIHLTINQSIIVMMTLYLVVVVAKFSKFPFPPRPPPYATRLPCPCPPRNLRLLGTIDSSSRLPSWCGWRVEKPFARPTFDRRYWHFQSIENRKRHFYQKKQRLPCKFWVAWPLVIVPWAVLLEKSKFKSGQVTSNVSNKEAW
jgi:hypothetical protein